MEYPLTMVHMCYNKIKFSNTPRGDFFDKKNGYQVCPSIPPIVAFPLRLAKIIHIVWQRMEYGPQLTIGSF